MKKVILDANPFLRLFLNDIPSQVKEFERLLEKSKTSDIRLFVPQIVIFELSFALEKYYGFSKNEIVKKLKSVVQSSYLQVQDEAIFSNAFKIYEANNISFSDSFILEYSHQIQGELFTFDKKLKKLA